MMSASNDLDSNEAFTQTMDTRKDLETQCGYLNDKAVKVRLLVERNDDV
jgi:hypothetical protein